MSVFIFTEDAHSRLSCWGSALCIVSIIFLFDRCLSSPFDDDTWEMSREAMMNPMSAENQFYVQAQPVT